ncbi:Uncharacterized protein HZ326_28137 [Fusarium oxysporum f. sp. albedinis]|nr:Uncharacterized protein HZ326_28137 [Fusarium oxysporum f. sp. albedinis]
MHQCFISNWSWSEARYCQYCIALVYIGCRMGRSVSGMTTYCDLLGMLNSTGSGCQKNGLEGNGSSALKAQ